MYPLKNKEFLSLQQEDKNLRFKYDSNLLDLDTFLNSCCHAANDFHTSSWKYNALHIVSGF